MRYMTALAILLASWCWVPDLRADGPAETLTALDQVQKKLARAMAAWTDLRDQRIDVKTIEGLGGNEGTKALLEKRLKTLLTKKRSNREWNDYWATEAKIVNEIAGYYEQLAPLDSKSAGLAEGGLTGLVTRRDAAAAALKALDEVGRQAAADSAGAVRWLQLRQAEGAKLAVEAPNVQKKLTKALETAKKAHERAVKAKGDAEIDADADTEFMAKVNKAAASSLAQRQQAQAALDKHIAAGKAQLALAGVVGGLKSGDPMTVATLPQDLTEAANKKAIVAVEAPAKAVKHAAGLQKAKAALTLASGRLAEATGAAQRYRERRASLKAWAQLAADKELNQTKYYEAINADIAAVEERLRGLAGNAETGPLGQSTKTCAAPRGEDQTSLQRYHACRDATNEELESLATSTADATAARRLNELQIEALALLLKAQTQDDVLVRRERALAEAEASRSKASAVETDDWRTVWEEYATRARDKAATLRAAVRTSKDTHRQLNVNVAFYSSELATMGAQRERLAAALVTRTGNGRLVKAVAKTAWEYLRRAYMVPIYLFIAWLLLRLSGRVEARVVAKARENQQDQDAVQRVETLSTVARGAVRLVVYIAALLMCLVAINVDVGPLLGGAAIFGLAISFGSQSLVKDVVTGFFILLEDQYAVGDYISTAGVEGTVEKVSLRRTVLRDLRGAVHNVPNGSITTVSNMSQGWARVVIEIGVAYGTDLEQVQEVVDALGNAMYAEPEWSNKLMEAPRYIGMIKFDASSIVFRLMFRTEQLENYGAEREFNRRLHIAFNQAGIEIPYDRMDVSVTGLPST